MSQQSQGNDGQVLERGCFMGFSSSVWILLAVEFVERLGYYAVAFSLFTYCTNMLRTGASAANAIVNAVYIVIPVAAWVSSGLADGKLGRPAALLASLATYAMGLLLLTVSSLPVMYGSFPYDPSTSSFILFAVGLTGVSLGYGGMKVCTNPMMADSVAATATIEAAAAGAARVRDGEEQDEAIARLFYAIYWVANSGGLVGIFVAPFLRALDSRTVVIGDSTFTSGYYYGNWLATCSVMVGFVLFLCAYSRFQRNIPAPSFALFRICCRALYVRLSLALGRLPITGVVYKDWLSYAAYPRQEESSIVIGNSINSGRSSDKGSKDALANAEGMERSSLHHQQGERQKHLPPTSVAYGSLLRSEDNDAQTEDVHPSVGEAEDIAIFDWIADCRTTIAVCKAFVALPVYWLICNQFSTNLMYQASALCIAPGIPPEVFNNINTFTVLLSLPLWNWAHARWCAGRATPVVPRVIIGFLLMLISMLWCGVVQVGIQNRGSYVDDGSGDEDAYVLNNGATRMSAMWLVVPYILQGLASALVDPAIMEAAYVGAPARMKGQVMGLYWVASSASGFLGVALSPIMKPQNAVGLFFGFAVSLLVVTVLFYLLNRQCVESEVQESVVVED